MLAPPKRTGQKLGTLVAALALMSGCALPHRITDHSDAVGDGSDAFGEVVTLDVVHHDAADARDVTPPSDVPEASVCPSGQVKCGGQCVSTATDTGNCGGCGNACVGATACANGTCVCPAADMLCGLRCVATQTDGSNCGTCNHACPSGQFCSGGNCMLSCGAGTMACGASCADTQTDPNNCGGCGNVCNLPHATAGCAGGHCTVMACATGTMDCNHMPVDGCEISTATDPSNCGICGTVCPSMNAVAGCISGSCTLQCNAGWGNCDGIAANGCEDNTTSDNNNCGSCTNGCALLNAQSACVNSACAITSCTGPYLQCSGPTSGGCAVDPQTDPNNCGSCGHGCPYANETGITCSNGNCVPGTCVAPYMDCGNPISGGCNTNTNTDNNHCGGCNTMCNNGMTCQTGLCACPSTQMNCAGHCVDVTTNNNNCGTCNVQCMDGSNCVGSSCTCGGGQSYCNNQCVNEQTDNQNCGGCGITCNHCNNGRCN